MKDKIAILKDYIIRNEIVEENDILNITNDKLISYINKEIKVKNSNINIFIDNIINENNIYKLEELGDVLSKNQIQLSFANHKISLDNIELLKKYISYADEGTYSNKGAVIKAIIKANDLDGVEILIKYNFITGRNVDKYINFAINSGKYDLVPSLIEKKNA